MWEWRARGWVKFIKWVRQQYRRVRGRKPNQPPPQQARYQFQLVYPPAARSCTPASRYGWFRGHITAFTYLGTWLCHSVHAVLLATRRGLQRCLFSSSPVLGCALQCRHGFGSLAQRAGVAIASSMTMWPFLSRAFVKKGHIVTYR